MSANNPQGLPKGYTIEQMRETELAVLREWALNEGWNPGQADINIASSIDPDAFIALRQGSDLAGGGSIFSYGGQFGFMGLFIVHPDHRGKGLGTLLWNYRLQRLRQRLTPGATIGMDGVLAMAPFYARGGFVKAHKNIRFQGTADGVMDPHVVPIRELPFEQIATYDQEHFPAQRGRFLERWISQPGAWAIATRGKRGEITGYGIARPCHLGYRLGPVFCDRTDDAKRIITSLMSIIPGTTIQIDLPEPNKAGMQLARQLNLTEVFACERMYHGPAPRLPLASIYGMTSLEFG